MIVDLHTHLGVSVEGRKSSALFSTSTGEQLIQLLDKAGIEKAVTFAPSRRRGTYEDLNYEEANRRVFQEISKWLTRLIGYGRVNPTLGKEAIREARRCVEEYGFRGLKLHPDADGFRPSDLSAVRPIMEFATGFNLPVLFHSGYEPMSEPALFLPLAESFPDVKIILGHMAYRMAGDAIIVARRASNVYLETSGNWDDLIKLAIRMLGAERVLFGSNLPYQIPEVEIMKVSLQHDVSQEDKDLVLGGNAARLHGLAS